MCIDFFLEIISSRYVGPVTSVNQDTLSSSDNY